MKPKKSFVQRRHNFSCVLLPAVLFITCCTAVHAVDWDGSASTDWNDPLNWPGDVVPAGAAAGIQSVPANIATISTNSTFTPSEVIIGGWFATGRLDHTAGTLATQNVGWPPGWFLVGFGATGTATYNLADTAGTGGAFTGFGTGSGSLNVVDAMFLGEPGGSTSGTGVATVNINTTGTFAVAYDLNVGVSGWTGNMNLDSGAVTANNLHVGKTQNANATAAIGNFKMSGGSATLGYRLGVANGAEGVLTGANVGTVTVSGGTLRTDNLSNDWWASGVNLASGVWNNVNGSGIGGSGGNATFNLDGGTLSTHWVFSEKRVDNMGTPENTGDDVTYAKGNSTFNFNGGTLQAQANMDVPWLPFMGNDWALTNAFVKSGGAIFDSNGFNILVGQPLLEDAVSTGGGLIKNGAGQLELTGANTFTGPVVVNAGTLFANAGNGPTNRSFSFADSITVNTGATLKVSPNSLFGWDGSQAKPLTVNAGATAIAIDSDQNVGLVTLNGGTLASQNPNVDWGTWNFGRALARKLHVTENSTVTAEGVGFQNGASVEVEAEKTLTFSGTITNKVDGVSSLTKLGDGTMVLSGANTYTGATSIFAGTLVMNSPTLSDSASVTLFPAWGAVLNLNYAGTDVVDSLVHDGVQLDAGLYRSAEGSGDGTVLDGLTGTGKLQVTNGPPVAGYSTWATLNVGGAAADVDTDLDGVSNGVEYFMNSTSDFTPNPGPDGSNTVTWPNGGNIPAADYGSQFVVQTSTDLANWTDVPLANLASNADGPGGSVSYTLTGTGKQFVRLKVTPN